MPPFLYSDIFLSAIWDHGEIFLEKTDLKSLLAQEKIQIRSENFLVEIIIWTPKSFQFQGQISVQILEAHVKKSPLKLAAVTNFADLTFGNDATRSGKNIEDLEESDLKAMGYNDSTFVEKNGKKSVSFHQNCTLITHDSEVENGVTKTDDGNQRLDFWAIFELLPSEASGATLTPLMAVGIWTILVKMGALGIWTISDFLEYFGNISEKFGIIWNNLE